jgi:hypothetical protein
VSGKGVREFLSVLHWEKIWERRTGRDYLKSVQSRPFEDFPKYLIYRSELS